MSNIAEELHDIERYAREASMTQVSSAMAEEASSLEKGDVSKANDLVEEASEFFENIIEEARHSSSADSGSVSSKSSEGSMLKRLAKGTKGRGAKPVERLSYSGSINLEKSGSTEVEGTESSAMESSMDRSAERKASDLSFVSEDKTLSSVSGSSEASAQFSSESGSGESFINIDEASSGEFQPRDAKGKFVKKKH